mgnify:FL=1
MTYQTFKENIRTVIQNKLGESVNVRIQDIIKNNNMHLDGLSVFSNEINVSPTIYLNPYFKKYQNGMPLDDIYREILKIYEENKPAHNIDVTFFTNYELAKKRIIFKLVHYERNKSLLDKVPHIRILDLAVIFYCLVAANDTGSATILVYNQHLALWGATAEELYQLALENAPHLLPYDLRDMSDVLTELMAHTPPSFSLDEADFIIPMYVLTNRSKLNGASCLLYPQLLQRFSKKINDDLYIIPSSVHEVLLLPAKEIPYTHDLSDIIHDVNKTQLSPEEILSDHVYYYSAESGQLSIPIHML